MAYRKRGKDSWGGTSVTAARKWMSQFLPLPCHRCGRVVLPEHRWQIDHIVARADDPSLTWDRENWAVSHGRCNEKAGSLMAAARARGRTAGATVRAATRSDRWNAPDIPHTWADVCDWGLAPPHYFSEPHPEAAASLFDTYRAEAEAILGITFLPWQAMVLHRGLEVDADGEFCWRRVVVSVSRQAGKDLDCGTPILTANRGWTTMGDLVAGDEVFAPDGSPTEVVAAHPREWAPFGAYRVTLTDGRSLVAGGEHLWEVFDHARADERRVLTTSQLLAEGMHRWQVGDQSWPDRWRERPSIKSIERVPDRWMRCITVARGDGMFLAGRELVPTHNSTGLLRPLAVIRALWARDNGSPQFILHVARRREAAKKLLVRPDAVRLAEAAGINVRQANGTERWLWDDGTLWQVFAVSGVYGESANLVLADECWDVSDDEFNEGLVPTMTESEHGQLWMVSAAHENATDLMLKERARAIAGTGASMIAEWSASADDDPFDPRTWWSASPRWTRARFETIKGAIGNRSIVPQFLNVWPEHGPAAGAVLAFPGWAGLPMAPEHPPAGAVGAVERAAPGMGWGVAAAAPLGDGAFGVWTRVVDTLPAAEAFLRSWGVVWALAGASFAPDMTVPSEAATSTTLRAALPNVMDMVAEGRVAHDHDIRAAEQFARCQRTDTDMGVAVSAKRSGGPIAVVKAAVWALEAARRFEAEGPAIY